MPKKVKYTFALPAQTAEKLEELSELESASKPEVLRKAITLYSYVHKEVIGEGMNLCIADNDGKIVKTIVTL